MLIHDTLIKIFSRYVVIFNFYRKHPSSLTDKQRQVIKNIVEYAERKRKRSLRETIKGMVKDDDTKR